MCILYPPATPWVIAGGMAAGALAEGGMEIYKESKTGEYDWRKILIKTLGGSLKGALAASPLKPLATGLGVATNCLTCGETHEQALKSAAINGPIEGLTVGGCKWLGNAVKSNAITNRVESNNPLNSIKYTDKVKSQMELGDYHSFPGSVDGFGSMGKVSRKVGGDGVTRIWVEIDGGYFGKDGIFQYIIEPDGTCNHRLFIPGGNK